MCYINKNKEGLEESLVLRTSGTSNKPRLIFHTRESVKNTISKGVYGLSDFKDILHKSKIINVLSGGELNGAYFFVENVLMDIGCTYYGYGPSNTEEISFLIKEHNIQTIIGTPSTVLKIIHSNENVFRCIKNIFYIGEGFSEEDRKKLVAKNIYSFSYSTSETGPIGYQCRHCKGDKHHLHDQNIQVIIPKEKRGKIVVSTNDLDEYFTGDFADFLQDSCDCGFSGYSIKKIKRNSNSISIFSNVISSELIENLMKEVGVSLGNYQFIFFKNKHNEIKLRILISEPFLETKILHKLENNYDFNYIFSNNLFKDLEILNINQNQFKLTNRGKKKPLILESE